MGLSPSATQNPAFITKMTGGDSKSLKILWMSSINTEAGPNIIKKLQLTIRLKAIEKLLIEGQRLVSEPRR